MLKEIVTDGSCPKWFNERGPRPLPSLATALRGTNWTLGEMDPCQFSSHLGLDRDRGASLDIPDGTDLHRYGFLSHRANDNRYGGRDRLS